MKNLYILFLCIGMFLSKNLSAQDFMTNIPGRNVKTLNGKWNAIVDLYDQGENMKIYLNKKPIEKTDLYEYSFDNSATLNVPGDWNSQDPELKYYESTVWYARHFDLEKERGARQYLYFCAVNYACSVYLNGQLIGTHEGGFTPFQFEITDVAEERDNFLAVKVNSMRSKDAIPALSYDWWNYGGITRDVMIVYTSPTYIHDYFIQLDKYQKDQINGWIKLDGDNKQTSVIVEIPELKIKKELQTDANGYVSLSLKTKNLIRWSPENPKLYHVILTTSTDRVEEEIGFRNLYVKGTDIYLNDEPIFMRGVNFHEEIPQRQGRAFSEADATMLLNEAKDLGCNMIRLSHYPQNEHIVRMAEKMGFLLWEEIPMWQKINFDNPTTLEKAGFMTREMVMRDKNRCSLAFWGVANETQPSEARNKFLSHLKDCILSIDTTRLITAAFDLPVYNPTNQTFEMDDSFTDELDVVSINKYVGWYFPWPVEPEEIKWDVATDKPLIFSEFGGEALYGQSGDCEQLSSWSEEYQEKLYKDNLRMFENISNLRGTCPWALYDFRSPYRFHPLHQEGWNRKGLVSDQSYRKKAWFVMKNYYDQLK